jgi:hypothetical protein
MRFPPCGLQQVLLTYGDPRGFHDNQALWEETILRYLSVPPGMFLWLGQSVRTIRVHNLAAPSFGQVVHTLAHNGVSGIEYGGTYNFRLNRNNPNQLSTHTWGIAIDLNPTKCPNGSNPNFQDVRLIAAFREAQFVWGGTWAHPDPMHFQLAEGI